MSSETEQEDTLDSAAAVMLGALAKASTELERTVVILTGQLALFNQGLSEQFQLELKRIEKKFETTLEETKDELDVGRDALINQLEQLKLAEIQAIRKTGTELRAGLSSQVQDSLSAFSGLVSGRASEIEQWLSVPEGKFQAKYDENERAWNEECISSRTHLQKTALDAEDALLRAAKELKSQLLQATSAAKHTLESLSQQSLENGKSNIDSISLELSRKEEEQNRELTVAERRLFEELSGKENALKEKLQSTLAAGEKSSQTVKWSYEYSVESISKSLGALHESDLKNIAARALTEISTNAQQAELAVAGIKVEFQSELNQLKRDYHRAFEAIYARLEKTIAEETKFEPDRKSSRILKEKRYKTHLRDLVGKIGNEMITKVSTNSVQIETDFLKGIEVFERRIEVVKSHACESLERETRLIKKELQQGYMEFEKQIAELEMQISRIEKAGTDAASIVATIKKANLKF